VKLGIRDEAWFELFPQRTFYLRPRRHREFGSRAPRLPFVLVRRVGLTLTRELVTLADAPDRLATIAASSLAGDDALSVLWDAAVAGEAPLTLREWAARTLTIATEEPTPC
jgi:hypothetical protein